MLRTKKRAKLCECKRCMGRPEHVRRVLFREMLEALKELLSLDTLGMHVIGDSYPDCPDCKLVEKVSKLIRKVESPHAD